MTHVQTHFIFVVCTFTLLSFTWNIFIVKLDTGCSGHKFPGIRRRRRRRRRITMHIFCYFSGSNSPAVGTQQGTPQSYHRSRVTPTGTGENTKAFTVGSECDDDATGKSDKGRWYSGVRFSFCMFAWWLLGAAACLFVYVISNMLMFNKKKKNYVKSVNFYCLVYFRRNLVNTFSCVILEDLFSFDASPLTQGTVPIREGPELLFSLFLPLFFAYNY